MPISQTILEYSSNISRSSSKKEKFAVSMFGAHFGNNAATSS
jgi:hypothetical protein